MSNRVKVLLLIFGLILCFFICSLLVQAKYSELTNQSGIELTEVNNDYSLLVTMDSIYYKPTDVVNIEALISRSEIPSRPTFIGNEGGVTHFSIKGLDNDLNMTSTTTDTLYYHNLNKSGQKSFDYYPNHPKEMNIKTKDGLWPIGKYELTIEMIFDEYIMENFEHTKVSDASTKLLVVQKFYIIDYQNIFDWLFK